MALLELRDVNAFYGRIQALRKVSLEVDKGEVVALIGSNGAGKTTTLRTISGLMHPAGGTIHFDGRDITHTGPSKIVELGISQSPEGRRLFPRMTVVDNLFMGAYSRNDKPGITSDMDRVFTLFPRLKERRAQIAGTLSGGEQQMLAMGRAMMARPKVLMLDEPSLGLAPILIETMLRAYLCCWSSRTLPKRSRSLTAPTCSKPERSSRPAPARSSRPPRTSRKRTSGYN